MGITSGSSSNKSSTLSVMRFTKLTPIVSCENIADMEQQQAQKENANVNGETVSVPGKKMSRNSQIKRKSVGLIESVTRVNVSDGIFTSAQTRVARKDAGSSHQPRSGSTSAPAASLDSISACPIAVLGSSSSTDGDNEQPSASIDYNSDEDPITSIRNRFNALSPVHYLAARNAALASSNSSLNGSVSSATSNAAKLTVLLHSEN